MRIPIEKSYLKTIISQCDDFESFSDIDKKDILLYGDTSLDNNKNKIILEATLN